MSNMWLLYLVLNKHKDTKNVYKKINAELIIIIFFAMRSFFKSSYWKIIEMNFMKLKKKQF